MYFWVTYLKWKSSQTTFNNFTPPPQKRGLFFGGGKVFGIFPSIFCVRTKFFFWWKYEASRNFWWVIRPILTNLWLFEIQKIWDFQYFWANLATFFFKMRFWAKVVLEPLKMCFLRLFRSWRWCISIFYPISTFEKKTILCIFYVVLCSLTS